MTFKTMTGLAAATYLNITFNRFKVLVWRGLGFDPNRDPTGFEPKPLEGRWGWSSRKALYSVAAVEITRDHYPFKGGKICVSCSNKAIGSFKKCTACREVGRNKIAERRRLCKEKGICYLCGRPARPGGLLCQEHRDRASIRERRRNDHPNCVTCGQVSLHHPRYCRKHIQEGLKVERSARLVVLNTSQTCPHCGIWGHTDKHCHKLHPEVVQKPPLGLGFVEGRSQDLPTRTLPASLSRGQFIVWLGRSPVHLPDLQGGPTLRVGHGVQVMVAATPEGKPPVVEHNGALYLLRGSEWRGVPALETPAPGLMATIPPAITGTPIDTLILPARASNACDRLQLRTVGDLLLFGSIALADQRNVGRRTINDLQRALARIGAPRF